MYAFQVSIDIAASRSRIWRALCNPAEVVQWDTGVSAALDAPPDYPQPGQHVHWTCNGGAFEILHDRPYEVVGERTLRSLLRRGPFYYDETYTLEPSDGGCRLTAALEVQLPLGILARIVERLYLGPQTRAAVSGALAGLKRHCEREESAG